MDADGQGGCYDTLTETPESSGEIVGDGDSLSCGVSGFDIPRYSVRELINDRVLGEGFKAREMTSGFEVNRMNTYILHAPEVRRYKIGKAISPVWRHRQIQTMSPTMLTPRLFICGDIEKQLHACFAQWRVHGEWFDECEELDRLASRRRRLVDGWVYCFPQPSNLLPTR